MRTHISLVAMASQIVSTAAYYYPAESEPHVGTLMTWPTVGSVFGFNINRTRADIAGIATAISRHEPLHLFVKNDTNNLDSARSLLGNTRNVFIHVTESVESLWARDTGPVFVRDNNAPNARTSGVVLNFNEWGQKLDESADRDTAEAMLTELKIPAVHTGIVSEGGALEVDGDGTLMATESSILEEGRNPKLTKKQAECNFKNLFGVTKTIWFKGAQDDITDDHVDSIARFVTPGTVVVTKPYGSPDDYPDIAQAKSVLESATDAKGRKIKIVEIPEPDPEKLHDDLEFGRVGDLTLSYVNHYVCNGAVILAKFGDKEADENARNMMQALYPDRVIEQVQLTELAGQGGGIHCATQQILAH